MACAISLFFPLLVRQKRSFSLNDFSSNRVDRPNIASTGVLSRKVLYIPLSPASSRHVFSNSILARFNSKVTVNLSLIFTARDSEVRSYQLQKSHFFRKVRHPNRELILPRKLSVLSKKQILHRNTFLRLS
jgi:protein gp37